jgi:16S rRNA (cytidine1402-2'-O)-methyltransferase
LLDALLSSQTLARTLQKLHGQEHKPGLYVVATPIGNIFDITLRAIYILKTAERVFAEDTRVSKKLFNFYDIKTPLVSCHEHNETDRSVVSLIEGGNIYALISDAGTPLISDPGYRLINWCTANGIDVFPVPGACSPIAGISVAGLPTDTFTFHGFLPPKRGARKMYLDKIKCSPETMIFLESPKRVFHTLVDMLEIFGDRFCCICREITKIFEESRRANLSELVEYFSANKALGELVIIISGDKLKHINENEIIMNLRDLLKFQSPKNAVKEISKKYNARRSLIYKKAIEIKDENE